MYPISDAFKNAIINGGTWLAQADVLNRGVPVLGGESLPVVGGTITVDGFAEVRRRAMLRLAVDDPKWIPDVSNDLLFPAGAEVSVKAGFRFDTGDELVPQGIFRISKPSVTVASSGDVQLSLDCYDRSRSVKRDRFRKPYIVAAGTNFSEAIKAIILRTFPWMTDEDFRFMLTDYTTPQLVFDTQDDPWVAAMSMASSFGAELFFDVDGPATLRQIPDPSSLDPCWDYVEGDQATITDLVKDLDDELAYNGCIVTGMNTSTGTPPVRGEAWDLDPSSPTYYDPTDAGSSQYGAVPFFITSEYVTTTQQATDAAVGNLQTKIGILKEVSFSAVPNPAHDASDVVHVENETAKVDDIHVMDSFTFDLPVGSLLTAITRQRRVLS